MRYRILDQKGMNFLTMTIVEWIDLFSRKIYRDIIIESLAHCRKEKGLKIFAYVIMSNHLHFIVRAKGKSGLSKIIQDFKSYTAKQIINYLNDRRNIESRRAWLLNHFAFNARKNQTNSHHQIWQRDNHPIELYTPSVIRQKLLYIHRNPVEAGWVELPEHYLYSSAANYKNAHLENGQETELLAIDILDDIWDDTGFVFMGR